MARAWGWVTFLVILATVPACQNRRTRTLPAVPQTGDAQARERFNLERQRFQNNISETPSSTEFESIAEQYPNDPVADYARLYAGIVDYRSGRYEDSLAHLSAVADSGADKALKDRAHLFLGLAHNHRGDHRVALGMLSRGKVAITAAGERAEWLAALANVHFELGNTTEALGFLSEFYRVANPIERHYVESRIRDLVMALSADELPHVFERYRGTTGPARYAVGARLVSELRTGGRMDAADELEASLGAGIKRFAVTVPSGNAQPNAVAALLPMTGRRWRIGRSASRVLAMVSGTFGALSDRTTTVHDTASTTSGAEAAMAAAIASPAIAAIGPTSTTEVRATMSSSASSSLPLITLDPMARAHSATTFNIIHSAEQRAVALAQYAAAQGIRDFGVFRPSSGYGRAVARAFSDEVRRLGARVLVEVDYDPKATSFGGPLRKLKKPWKALFIPDTARRLELIVPALAAANFISQPSGAKAPKRGRGYLLLSTAEALSPRFERTSGRYARGAVLAPGFFPDRTDTRNQVFIEQFEAAFGGLPSALDAHAYDAAHAVAFAAQHGVQDRRMLVQFMRSQTIAGVTGDIRFDAEGRRSDTGVLYRIEVRDGQPTVATLRGLNW